MRRLSRAADRSLLWLGIAAVLGASGKRFGRRAALRGVLSVATTSALVNLPGKLLARRRRPSIDPVPEIRRLTRLPRSTSFPSGHSASAFAFATGAGIEKPALVPPLLGLAGAVAYSRVHTGVHYPTDALGGALIGVGVALVMRTVWPPAPEEGVRLRPALTRLHSAPSPDGAGLVIVVNVSAGSDDPDDVVSRLRDDLPRARLIELEDGAGLREVLESGAEDATAVGVVGGDGSVNAAAGVAHAKGKALVIVPGGTLNHFARSLGIDDVDGAVRAVRGGESVGLDVGTVAGRVFLNGASIGGYTDLVDLRERLEGRLGKWMAALVALAWVLRRSSPVPLEVDGRSMRVWMLFVGNCRYHADGFTPMWRDRLDDGLLDVRILDASRSWARTRFVWAFATGMLDRCPVYRRRVTTQEVVVRSQGGPIRLACDGETFDGPEEVCIAKSTGSLTIFAPSESGEGQPAPNRSSSSS